MAIKSPNYADAFKTNLTLVMREVLSKYERDMLLTFLRDAREETSDKFPDNTNLSEDLYQWVADVFHTEKGEKVTEYTKKFMQHRVDTYRNRISKLKEVLSTFENDGL
jgi:hypothetical protein